MKSTVFKKRAPRGILSDGKCSKYPSSFVQLEEGAFALHVKGKKVILLKKGNAVAMKHKMKLIK